MFGFHRTAAAVPVLKVGDTVFNSRNLLVLYREACAAGAAAVVFPELSVTGYSCGDLFLQERLLNAAAEACANLAAETSDTVMVFGAPLRFRDALYNCAVIAQNGAIRGVVPKTFLPNHRELYEKRHFLSGATLRGNETIFLGGKDVPFATNLVFSNNGFSFGVEIGEDLWSVTPPSGNLALGGAKIIFNLSAGTGLAGKAASRRDLVRQQSARCVAAYVLASAGVHESTTDAVFSGHALIADNGRLLVENQRFDRNPSIIFADIDVQRLRALRYTETTFNDAIQQSAISNQQFINLDPVPASPDLAHAAVAPHPFVPADPQRRRERCHEILAIQSAGLAKRIEHTGARTLVLGVSGGLDSTLALLVCVETLKLLGRPASDILAVTMPGFGTSGRTRANAQKLCQLTGATFREICIRESCLAHFHAIGHDPAVADTTYENVQARERTRILMNLANKHAGLVVGTGDLSEIALGWSTFNGDHMSMYAVNCSVPKTLIRFLIDTVAETAPEELAAVLRDIIDTPVSPELLPQPHATESLIGPYELHDFFLYHFLKYGAEPAKLRHLALHAFAGTYDAATVTRWLRVFLTRFFSQQFKRNCVPDGPKVGTLSLSPRADWRMPSDASAADWLAGLE